MFERRLYYHIDWGLLAAILALCGLGVAMIYSTTFDPTRGTSRMYVTQMYAIVLGLVAMGVMLTLDYRTFADKSHLIYIGVLALLLYVMFFGTVQMGARRWIALKFFNLQPSEFAKSGVALVLAKFFGENRGMPSWTDLAIGGTLTLIPLALIATNGQSLSTYDALRNGSDSLCSLNDSSLRVAHARPFGGKNLRVPSIERQRTR